MGFIKGHINKMNYNKICRICLEEKYEVLPFESKLEVPDTTLDVYINDVLKILNIKVVNTEIPNSMPDLICLECYKLAVGAYVLKAKCEESLHLLEEYIKEFVKAEPADDQFTFSADASVNCAEEEAKCYFESDHTTLEDEDMSVEDKNFVEELLIAKEVKSASKVILHPCPICPKEFTALELREHAHSHKALKKYLTIPENKKISSEVKFYSKKTKHTTSLFNRAEKLHKCFYCNLEMRAELFKSHIEDHKKKSEFRCDKCDRVFRKVNHLSMHKLKHLKELPYKCEICEKGFVIKKNYDCHILTHKGEELPYKCNYCSKMFSNPEHLHRHQIIHTENVTYSEKYKVCKCRRCLRNFKDKSELGSHDCIPVKQTGVNFTCKQCKKQFKFYSSLKSHTRYSHNTRPIRTLCSVCGLIVANIYTHMMMHTGEKPYICDQCDKRFTTKTRLTQHLLVHTGFKPFVCSVCAKTFNSLYNLQVHERIHIGNKCHICPICNKGFLEKSYLKKHLSVHEKNGHLHT